MDLINFIPSSDIVSHVKKIGYKLTTADAICIVYNSNKTLQAKHAAYREIIKTMPDAVINDSTATLRTILKRQMELDDMLIAFARDLDCVDVTVALALVEDVNQDRQFDMESIEYEEWVQLQERLDFMQANSYRNWSSCYDAIKEVPKERLGNDLSKMSIRIPKMSDLEIIIWFDRDLEICRVDAYPMDGLPFFDDDIDDCDYIMRSITLDKEFALPFEHGDIVYVKEGFEGGHVEDYAVYTNANGYGLHYFWGDKPFYEKKIGVDRIISAVKVDPQKLDPQYAMLKALSALTKRKMDLYEFLTVYDYCRNYCFHPNFMTDEHFKKRGINFDL